MKQTDMSNMINQLMKRIYRSGIRSNWKTDHTNWKTKYLPDSCKDTVST